MVPFEIHVSADIETAIAGVSEPCALYDYWRSKSPPGGLPAVDYIDIGELSSLLANVMFLDVIDNGEDFVYRHYGAAIAEIYGKDMTGKSLLELRAIPLRRFLDIYRDIVATRQPRYSLHRIRTTLPSGRQDVCWERLMLPVAGDGGKSVECILAVNHLRDWTYREELY